MKYKSTFSEQYSDGAKGNTKLFQCVTSASTLKKNATVIIGLFLLLSLTLNLNLAQCQEFRPDTLYQIFTNSPVNQGDDLILYVSNGSSFSWTGPNGFSSSDRRIRIQNTSSSNSGTYYLTVFDSVLNNYRYLDCNVEVLDVNSTYITVTTPSACLSSIINFGVNSMSGCTIAWSTTLPVLGGFSVNSWQQSVTLSALATPGTYMVSCIITCQGSPTIYDTAYIRVFECCETNKPPIFLENEATSGINTANWPSTGNLTVVIKGYLSVNSTFSFPANVNEIVMFPRASIIVEPGQSLSIIGNSSDPTIIKGCEEMWDWIMLLDNSSIDVQYCIISDGLFAIYAPWWLSTTTAPSISVIGTRFTDNFFGMYTSFITQQITLEANTFTGTLGQNLLPTTNPTIVNFCYNRAYTGLYLWKCTPFIFSSNLINEFSNIARGIGSANSLLTINPDAARFSNIHAFVPCTNVPEGNAINAYGSGCVIKYGNSLSWTPDIDDCDVGISVYSPDAILTGINMTNVKTGVKVVNCMNKSIYANDNKINCTDFGFWLFQNAPTASLEISDNIINLNTPVSQKSGTACIKATEFGITDYNYKILTNELNVNTGSFGIDILNVTGILVQQNTINLLDPAPTPSFLAGIKLTKTDSSSIRCNHIYSVDAANGDTATRYPFGILSTESAENDYFFNDVHDIFTGVGFVDACNGTNFRFNQFNIHDIGLWYSYNAITDPQYIKANTWSTNCFSYKGFISNISNYILNLYTLGNNCTTCDPNPYLNYPQWFDYDNQPTPASQGCELGGGGGEESSILSLNAADSALAAGSVDFGVFQEELQWNSSRYLYDKLNAQQGLLASNSLMSNYLDSIEFTSAALIESYCKETIGSLSLEPVSEALTDSLRSNILSIMDSLNVLASLLSEDPSSQDSLLYSNSSALIKQALINYNAQLEAAHKGLLAIREGNINTLLNDNGVLPDLYIFEANEKLVYQIYLNTIARGMFTFTEAQKSQIFSIAEQCPLSGGKAVYRARSILAYYCDTLFDDKTKCLSEGIIKSQQSQYLTTKPPEIRFSVFPNPASQNCTLTWNSKSDTEGIIEFYNTMGVSVFSKQIALSSGYAEISLSGVPPGVYYIRVDVNKQLIRVGKIVIIH